MKLLKVKKFSLAKYVSEQQALIHARTVSLIVVSKRKNG